jgi:hypothetical protein
MASESSERPSVSVRLPPALDEWLAERAEDAGIDPGELLVQLAATYRAAAEDDDAVDELANAVEGAATDAATERVDDRLGAFRSSLDSQLQEIRRRIVQLKHESDEKAERGRVDGLSTRLDGVEETLDGVDDSIGSIRDDVERLEGELRTLRETVEESGATGPETTGSADAAGRPSGEHGDPVTDEGFDERLEDIESKLVRVARVVVEMHDGGRGTLHGLKRVAAREGVRAATCAECAGTVDIGLLPDATCPHCDVRFRELAVDPTGDEDARLEAAPDPSSGSGGAEGADGTPDGDESSLPEVRGR